MESFLTSFFMVFTAEMGDKTQFLVLALSIRYGALPILLGAMLAFAVLNGPGVFIGEKIADLINPEYIKLISAGIFFFFGLYILLQKEESEEDAVLKQKKSGFILAFTTIFIGELGDKTQLCSVVLGARFKEFAYVFSGCFLALLAATLFGIILGSQVQKWLPKVPFKKIAGTIMIITGLITFLGTIS
jgi:putative Ca2+/H+ antiporter (TMEM165/GDT1 family)